MRSELSGKSHDKGADRPCGDAAENEKGEGQIFGKDQSGQNQHAIANAALTAGLRPFVSTPTGQVEEEGKESVHDQVKD